MQELEAQFLDGSLQTPLCQEKKYVPKGKIANEGASKIATPAAARKRTGHVTDEIRTVLVDLDENAATPKRKRRRKPGKKRTPVLSENQPAPTGEILTCVPHDRLTYDVSRITERELLRSVNLMVDVMKRLDRTAALQKEVQQVSSRLHKHIMPYPREGSDEVHQ